MSYLEKLPESVVEFYHSVLPDCDTEEEEIEAFTEFVKTVANKAYKLGLEYKK